MIQQIRYQISVVIKMLLIILKKNIIEKGIYLEIDYDIYHHKISANSRMCKKALCKIYADMRDNDIFNEEYLAHLSEYKHPIDEECKFADECEAFKRLQSESNDLKDRCHVMIFTHPPRQYPPRFQNGESSFDLHDHFAQNAQFQNGASSFDLHDHFAQNAPLYYPKDEESKFNKCNGYLRLLMQEMTQNGYKHVEMHVNARMMNEVEVKLKCERHKLMGSPLNRAEMLSLLLCTNAQEVYKDLGKSQRDGDYTKWKWFDYCLHKAISKLSKREHGSYKIYTGLKKKK
eukprot:544456_1